jgi:hypothetical protein
MKGWRKFIWGETYILGAFGLVGYALYQGMDAGVVAAVAAACVSLAPGLGVVIYGNVQEHANGGNDGKP